MKLPRVTPAVLTPCARQGCPDPSQMARLCRHLVQHGCDGLFILGSTGEASLLDDSHRSQLTQAARAAAPDITLMAGASGLGEAHTLRLIARAADDGADLAVLMAPYFVKLSQNQLRDYACRLADQSALPLGFYHHLRMSTPFEPETVAALACHPRIVAFKETSGCPDRMNQLAELQGDLALYQGSEALLLPSLRAGFHGSVTALANAFPTLIHDLTQAFLSGNGESVAQLQEQITACWRIFRQPETGQSFSHFLQTIYQPLVAEGILAGEYGMTGKLEADFYSWVSAFYQQAFAG